MPRYALPVLLVLLAWPAPLRAEVPKLAPPEARPIQLDGRPATAEWSDALNLELAPGTAIRMQQFRGTLMLALRSDRVWTEGSVLTLFFCPDGPKAGGRGPGCFRIDYEPFRHNRSHVIAYRYGEDGAVERVDGEVVARQSNGTHGAQVEMALPLRLLGLTSERRFPVRFSAQWARRSAGAMTYPTDLDLRGAPGRPPADFLSAARWALLEGFGDAQGPGAFPATAWKAWIDHDEELTRRGRAAHARIALLREEWKKEEKRDGELIREVIEPFAWIRKHEPLTGEDVIAMATAWRFLGRHDRATGVLDTLIDTSHDRGVVMRALHERALVHRGAERYDAEAADWTRLAELAGAQGAAYAGQATLATTQKTAWEAEQKARAAVEADPANPRVRLVTIRGEVEVVLHAKAVPEAVKHFLGLVDMKYYDGTLFHRVKGAFMAQGGDPKSRDLGCEFAGAGSSPAEIEMEINAGHEFFRGALCFARPPHKEQNGSQFFLMTAPKPDLGRYTIFGHVVAGMAAVDRIEMCDPLVRAVRIGK